MLISYLAPDAIYVFSRAFFSPGVVFFELIDDQKYENSDYVGIEKNDLI